MSFGVDSIYKINRLPSGYRCLLNEFGTCSATGADSLGLLNCLFLQSAGSLTPICSTCFCHVGKSFRRNMIIPTCASPDNKVVAYIGYIKIACHCEMMKLKHKINYSTSRNKDFEFILFSTLLRDHIWNYC